MIPAKSVPFRNDLDSFGFKSSEGGAHISRTIMLREISQILERAPGKMGLEDYRRAVVEENVLGKRTETTRQKTFRHLAALHCVERDAPKQRAPHTKSLGGAVHEVTVCDARVQNVKPNLTPRVAIPKENTRNIHVLNAGSYYSGIMSIWTKLARGIW